SKRPLSEALQGAGIGYVHLKALGTPPELRHAHRAGMDRVAFLTACREILGDREEGLREAAALLAEQPGCLVCVEANPRECHRGVVADLLLERGLVGSVRHLAVPGVGEAKPRRARRAPAGPEGE
ncbi:MAG TPA: DUF488 domain-containing protein, partial [Deinococcales bacterium]|nr:DUF488 domain-containing protein [Deinococcales bacterium]